MLLCFSRGCRNFLLYIKVHAYYSEAKRTESNRIEFDGWRSVPVLIASELNPTKQQNKFPLLFERHASKGAL
jgi:hypothetical protein